MLNEKEQQVNDSPLISVILPVYNSEKYIAEAIDSILGQTLSDFELIVINDGSSDNTLSILLNYQKKDPRVNIVSRENKGLITSLNEGIDLARGKWIARMDSDDIALPHRFERQIQQLDKTDADVCGSWVEWFGNVVKRRVVKLSEADAAIKVEMLFGSPFAHPTVMMRTSLIKRLHYDQQWTKAEDYDLWERIIEADGKLTNVPEVLLMYRLHNNQISIQSAEEQQQQGRVIRRRYWYFVYNLMKLNIDGLDEVLKVFTKPQLEVDMDVVDLAFTLLLRESESSTKVILLSHLRKIYISLAANCPDIVNRWSSINQEFGNGSDSMTKTILFLFHLFKIRENDFSYKAFKKFYFWCGGGAR